VTSTQPSKQPSGRVVTAIYAIATAAAVAIVTLATLHAVYWPIPIVVGAAVAAALDRALRAMGRQIDPNHIAIVGLAATVGAFATSTAVLASQSNGTAKLHLKVLSPPPSNVEVPEKVDGVSGTVSGLPEGDTIWVMVRTVGESRSYLMAEPCAVATSGSWECPAVYFGGKKPNYQHYEMLIQILDGKEQQRAISDWSERYWAHENDLYYAGRLGKTAAMVEVHRAG
jgi:hypothetical protein